MMDKPGESKKRTKGCELLGHFASQVSYFQHGRIFLNCDDAGIDFASLPLASAGQIGMLHRDALK
jgi:hypothetical protein